MDNTPHRHKASYRGSLAFHISMRNPPAESTPASSDYYAVVLVVPQQAPFLLESLPREELFNSLKWQQRLNEVWAGRS